ncbi:glycoside hydrolase family 15 protein [Streptomyces sp. SCSIO 30461]|uniref:glycoside hydrolase family 15 protein n=1 Tax=Streptomyces sp. SCSIO 30461 TaxID=3118085 RepID=UPI0030D57D8E
MNASMSAEGFPPISDFAFLSDGHSLALVGRDASVEWACFHRFDGPSVFARILDRERGGHFRIAPTTDAYTSTRRYLPDTNVLETTFRTSGGVVTVTDCLPVHVDPARPGHPARKPPGHVLQRHVHGVSGAVGLTLEFFPAFDYARSDASFTPAPDGALRASGGGEVLLLRSGLGPLEPSARQTGNDGFVSHATVPAGAEVDVVLTRLLPGAPEPEPLSARELADRVEATVAYWRRWAARCTYRGPYREAVVRSLLVLKGLVYADTGAVIAAPTTSLPEEIGGERNWDYRYTWVRDATAVLATLTATGYTDEARHFADWLLETTAGSAKELRTMYGVSGDRALYETRLDHLGGYRGSRPVRVGNEAWMQFQLDMYGEVLLALNFALRLRGDRIRPERVGFVHDLVELNIARWREPDEGIWEFRSGRRHFVFSKLMAWAAVDSGICLIDRFPQVSRDPELRARWVRAREEIREEIESRGVDQRTGAFVQDFGGDALDASALQLILRGFLPLGDPRIDATLDRIEAELTREGHVYRYLGADGLNGHEGSFLFCTLWLASALAYTGRIDEAGKRLATVLRSASDLGLLAEEFDPVSGEQLGNFPQGFSHLGVVAAALAIESAKRKRDGKPGGAPLDFIDALILAKRAV